MELKNWSEGTRVERTLIIVKPDAVQRGLAGEILSRFERRGLRLVALRLLQMDEETARRHYAEHVEKPFFEGLVAFITSSPVVVAVFEGVNAVAAARETMGATNPAEAGAGTIRGELGLDVGRNLVHGSDSVESAKREIAILFEGQPLIEWLRATDPWIFEPRDES